MYITTYQTNKPKMAQFLKFKFLNTLKFNFNGGQINKYQNLVISKSEKKPLL